MSRRAKKEALRSVRWREQVARLIAEVCPPKVKSLTGGRWTAWWSDSWLCSGGIREDVEREARHMTIARLLDGASFDVHAAREYGEHLLWRGHELTGPGHVDVVRDWCEEQGKTVHEVPPLLAPRGNGRALARLGRRLLAALEGQPSECPHCSVGCANCGASRGSACIAGDDGEWFCSVRCADHHDDHGCPLEIGLAEKPRRRALLHGTTSLGCCQGTGHNLGGVLPAVEWSAQLRRSLADANEHSEGVRDDADPVREVAQWQQGIIDGLESASAAPWSPSGSWWIGPTRVAPRGRHRYVDPDTIEDGLRDQWRQSFVVVDLETPGISVRESPDGEMLEMHESHVRAWHLTRLPRWLRGRLRHSEQRRERERRRDGQQAIGTVREVLEDGSVIVDVAL